MSFRKYIPLFLVLLCMAIIPVTFSTQVLYALQAQEFLLKDIQTIILLLVISVFTMAFALTPTTFIAILSGYFLPWIGLAGVVIAYLMAAVLGLLLGDLMGKLGVKYPTGATAKLSDYLNKTANRQLVFVALSRLSPGLPFAMTNIALSIFKIRWDNYILGSLIGMLPRTAVSFWAGKNAKDIWSFLVNPSLHGFYQLIPLLFALLSILGLIWIIKKAYNINLVKEKKLAD